MISNFARARGRPLFDSLKVVWDRATRYQLVARWIFSDSIWRFRWKASTYLTVSGVSLALQAFALALFLQYARSFESTGTIEIFGFLVGSSGSYLVLVAVIGLGGLIIVTSSFMRIYAERGFTGLGQQYAVYCAERIMVLVSSTLHGLHTSHEPLDQSEVRKLAIGSSQISARALTGIIRTLPMAAGFFVFSGFLLYLDVVLTLIIFAVVSVSLGVFYMLSIHSAGLMRVREEKKRIMAASYSSLTDLLRQASCPLESGHPLFVQNFRNGAFGRYFTQFLRAQVLSSQSAHIGTITQAAVLVIIGLVKGGEIISSRTGFGDLAVFLVTGRLAMTSLLGVTGSLVMINRFYPMISNHLSVVKRLQSLRTRRHEFKVLRPDQTLFLTASFLADSTPEKQPEIQCDMRLAVLAPKPVDRFDILEISSGIGIRGRKKNGKCNDCLPPGLCWLIPNSPAPTSLPLNELVGLPLDMDGRTLRDELASLGVTENIAATLPDDLGAAVDGESCKDIDPVAFWITHLLAANRSKRLAVFVGVDVLMLIEQSIGQGALDRLLANHLALIDYRPKDVSKVGRFGERYVVLHDGQTLLGYVMTEMLRDKPELLHQLVEKKLEAIVGDDMMDEDL